MLGPHYEWDPAKAAANVDKHGVSFDDAIEALEDPYAVIEEDLSDPTEYRDKITGQAGAGILIVITTDRPNNVIRIISARKAKPHEQTDYQRQALP